MKKILFFLFISIGLVYCQTPFKARLLNYSTDQIPPYCGVTAQAAKLKFELLDDFEELKKGENFFLIIACAREYGIENYVNNGVYTITIYGNSEEDLKHKEYGWTVRNTYELEKLPELWCKELKKEFFIK